MAGQRDKSAVQATGPCRASAPTAIFIGETIRVTPAIITWPLKSPFRELAATRAAAILARFGILRDLPMSITRCDSRRCRHETSSCGGRDGIGYRHRHKAMYTRLHQRRYAAQQILMVCFAARQEKAAQARARASAMLVLGTTPCTPPV